MPATPSTPGKSRAEQYCAAGEWGGLAVLRQRLPARPVVACVPHLLPRSCPAHSHAFERGPRYDNARCPIVCTSLRSASAVPEGCISLIAGLLRVVCSCETVSRATVLMQTYFSLPRALRGSVCRPARGLGKRPVARGRATRVGARCPWKRPFDLTILTRMGG